VHAKVRFPYGFQDHAKGFLYNPVVNGRDAQRPLFPIGFGDVHPSDRQWFKGLGLECFAEALKVSFNVTVEVAHRASVYTSRFSSLVGVDRVVRYSQPYVMTEQVIEIPILIERVLCRPLTKFLLHFAHIHR